LKLYIQKTLLVGLACAVINGLAHYHYPYGIEWVVAIVWPFLVYSLCFLEWEDKSKSKAIFVTAMVHTLSNMLPAAYELWLMASSAVYTACFGFGSY
jgi:hypothetical protein